MKKRRATHADFQVLLRCLADGDTEIFIQNGKYIPVECAGMASIIKPSAKKMDIMKCLLFEVYGKYPLSKDEKHDWSKNIRSLFNLN